MLNQEMGLNTRTWMALGMLALAGTAQAGDGNMNAVRQQIQVEAKDGKVIVVLSVVNGGKQPVYVPKAVYQDRELLGRSFEITEQSGGVALDYAGKMVKRGPVTGADFVAVKPGATLGNRIDITHSYAFKPGTHSYRLAYAGTYLTDTARLDAPLAAAAAPVAFTHTAR